MMIFNAALIAIYPIPVQILGALRSKDLNEKMMECKLGGTMNGFNPTH